MSTICTIWLKIKRFARMGRAVAQDARLPRWLRWSLVGCIALPLPGPGDEILAALLLAVVVWRFPDVWRDAKEGTA